LLTVTSPLPPAPPSLQADVIFDETYFVRPVNAPDLTALLARYDLTWNDVASFPAFANRKVSG
jgi:hypothetical protein